MSAVRTTCAYCGVGCGVVATSDGNGGTAIEGDETHPANFGRLCLKGTNLGQTLSSDGRLLEPMINGSLAPWDDATNLVAQKFKQAIDEHGPDSVAFYVSGQLLTEDYYVANKLMKGFIGSANIDTNSRLCMASSVVGHKRAFGADTVPGTYEDLEQADLIVLVGSNLAWCHPVLHQRIMAAKEKRGTQILNIDPRHTATSDLADVHLGIKPGGDVALFNGLLCAIADAKAVNEAYVKNYVNGYHEALSCAQRMSHSQISEKTGLSSDELTAFYRKWIQTKRVVTIYSQGVNQASDGSDKVNAIINCHLATGRIGQIGCGPFSVTGQPNAMGGREVGGLANTLAAHLDIENAHHREMVSAFWDAPNLPTKQGLKAVDLFEACASGQIKALWIMCTNPAVSMPRANDVVSAIKNVDFVAVSDIIHDTDTTRLADVLLPATGWGEKDGTVTNSERRISRQRGFLPKPGQTKHDWEIICEVASKMGYSAEFDFQSPCEVFREWAAMTELSVRAKKDLDLVALSDLSTADYDDLEPVQWPVKPDRSDTRMFANGGFFTEDQRSRMIPISDSHRVNETSKDYPFILNTGRVRDHWHTMTRSGKSSQLSRHMAEPYLEIHPDDAGKLGIRPATLVKVSSSHGEIILRALVTSRVQVGQVFSPIHWTSKWAAKARVDTLVPSHYDPLSGQPELKRAAVHVAAFNVACYGFALSKSEPDPTSRYWAKAQTKAGWRLEFGAQGTPLDIEQFARAELNVIDADAVIYRDAKKSLYRVAFVKDSVVVAAMFLGPEPVVLSRQFLTDKFDENTDVKILAGVSGANVIDAGQTICSCFDVGVNTLVDAIETGQANSLDAIGNLLQAGTNCGSCRPEIAKLVKAHRSAIAAE
jgi:assimilatory nitrate reductase catalytic subunit